MKRKNKAILQRLHKIKSALLKDLWSCRQLGSKRSYCGVNYRTGCINNFQRLIENCNQWSGRREICIHHVIFELILGGCLWSMKLESNFWISIISLLFSQTHFLFKRWELYNIPCLLLVYFMTSGVALVYNTTPSTSITYFTYSQSKLFFVLF